MKKTFTLVGVLTILAALIYFGYRYLTKNAKTDEAKVDG